MIRRRFLQLSLAAMLTRSALAALRKDSLDAASEVLAKSIEGKQVESAVLHVSRRDATFSRAFGKATSADAMFLLGSISKPICVTALMTLFDRGEFSLDDPLKKFLPQFTGESRDRVTIRHLLAHTSGLPDQLGANDTLRRTHAGLPEFIAHTMRTPLGFAPGTRYQYSSMGILLAVHLAEIFAKTPIHDLVDRTVFQPLGMKRSALGLGRFAIEDMVRMQTEHAAPESGGGDPNARDWDWNSPYWRKLGAPWGGVHASAPDIARWLTEFLRPSGAMLKPDTARQMITNHNPAGVTPRGLGFVIGSTLGGNGCSDQTFGHTGSTGTICWADPATEIVCVVLTSLPARAVQPHPRDLAARHVASAAQNK